MTLNSIPTSRIFKYSSVLLLVLIISFAYFFGYQAKSGYLLHFTTGANHLAVETVSWNLNGVDQTREEAAFSVDSILREHSIPLAGGKYTSFTINCDNPSGYKDGECLVKNLYISDIFGANVFSFGNDNKIHDTIRIPVDIFLNNTPSLLAGIYQFILHILPVCLILFIFLSVIDKTGIPSAIWFCIMFIYAMIVFPTINIGIDAFESISVAKSLFTPSHYYSYVEYRGFMWFFILWVINCTANLFHIDFYYCYTVYGCLIFTILLNYLLPNFAKNLGIMKVNYYNNMLLGWSIIFLYGRQFFCPLPDIIPIFLLLLGLNLLLYKPLYWKFFAGICVGISCLIRSNYYLSAIFILIFILCSMPRKFLTVILFLLPVVFLSGANKVLSTDHTENGVVQWILFRGMTVQKISPSEIKDKVGIKILEETQISSHTQLTLRKYLQLVINYPAQFLTMYSIRIFNGLDIKYSQVYSSDAGSRIMFTIINYILIFLGIYHLYNYLCYTRWRTFIYLLAATIPSLVMAVSFVETRYFLPLSLILVTLGTLSINIKLLKNKGFIFGLILFVICCLTVSASVYNQVS